MSSGPPISAYNARNHKHPRRTLTAANGTITLFATTTSSFSHNGATNVQDLHHLPHHHHHHHHHQAPQKPTRPSAQRKAAYLAGQSPDRKQMIEKHLNDFSTFAEGTREREGRSGGYFDVMLAANGKFAGLSKVEKAKMKKCRRMFKKAEVPVSMWKALAQKVFGGLII
ncbi:hypothetical protein B9Z19DRAFT_1126501 [Tuber borchii]|uniref:Uncharacterized protein n=1 Tax=Tuber borchii TaxID=42251 RepID=A0A2T6ZSY3_TUBBO|nr:hypothetical protein B9Z19DRAFT_1126501 [Tuber borchii]